MAAEKASVRGQAQEQTSDVATDIPASERPCSISLAKLPAWPLTQTVLAQASPVQGQSMSQPQHASRTGHQHSTAGGAIEHADVESQGAPAGRSCQQPRKEACSALLDSLRLCEGDACHETEHVKIRAGAAPHLVQAAQNVTAAGNADSNASFGADLGAELPCGCGCPGKEEQHRSASVAAAVPEVISDCVLTAHDQTASVSSAGVDVCNNVDSCDPVGSSVHDLRERATASEELIGRELYIRASLLNHSCYPNCVVARNMATASVHALRDIEVSRMQSARNACLLP